MLNKLFLLLFWTYVTTTFLYYLSLTKLKIHQIQNDCTNQSISDEQIQNKTDDSCNRHAK